MIKSLENHFDNKRNNFDFIRFLASILVIFSHSFALSVVSNEPLSEFSAGRFTFGSIAVAIFFIISGMFICQSFQRSASIYTFTLSRCLRIFPALIPLTILTTFVLGALVTSEELKSYFSDKTTYSYLQNISAIKIQFELPGVFEHNPYVNVVNGSLWSLRYEIICYCLVVAVGIIYQRKFLIPFLIILVLAGIFRDKLLNITLIYFFIGSMIYVFRRHIRLSHPLAFLSLISLIANIHFNTNLATCFIINAICLGYLIIYLGFSTSKYFHNFTKYGDFSYGIYIYAFPVQQLLYYKIDGLQPISCFIIATLTTIVLAILSWHFVEKKALTLKQKIIAR